MENLNTETITGLVFALVGLFSAVAAITPNKSDNKLAQKALDLINLFGGNIGNAKNKDE